MLKLELEMKLDLLVQLKYSAAAAVAIYFKLFCGWNSDSLPDIDFFGSGANSNEWMVGWMDGWIHWLFWMGWIDTHIEFSILGEIHTHTQFETYNFNGLPLKIRNQVFVERTTGGYRSRRRRHSHWRL